MGGVPVTTVYQPIVDLHDGSVVAVEALARGHAGPRSDSPTALFARAGASGPSAVRRLDLSCLRTALAGLRGLEPLGTAFVNLEPLTIASLTPAELAELAAIVPADVQVVVEVTERSLLEDPAGLLAGIARMRKLGWCLAVDDVGAEPAALALLPFLAPDVIKLDLSLVQAHASLRIAAIVHAVRAEAESTGALILAEGIETHEHLQRALSMGARLGQGWRFGRPVEGVAARRVDLPLPGRRAPGSATPAGALQTPFELLSRDSATRRVSVPVLAAVCRHIERQALLLDELAVVTAHFPRPEMVTGHLPLRFEALASATALTAVLAPGPPLRAGGGIHCSTVDRDDPLASEWVLTVASPPYTAALAAREAPRVGAQQQRCFDYVLTHDRQRVVAASALLVRRLTPLGGHRVPPPVEEVPAPVPRPAAAARRSTGLLPGGELPELLLRAIDTAGNGIVIVDALAADLPIVHVNDAFLRLTGYPEHEVLGRNCRFLQGPETDRVQTRRIADHLARGSDVQSVLLNYRRNATPFWNEVTISAVHRADGRLTHFIGNQVDVTQRVHEQQQATARAMHDPLTGLPNRLQLRDHLELELARARRTGSGVAVLFLDLDDFKAVNDTCGHRVGDLVLAETAARMQAVVRAGDLLARFGGDEFVIVLGGLPRDDPHSVQRLVEQLHEVLAEPIRHGGRRLSVGASIGTALFPADGDDAEGLLDLADAAMYRAKHG